MTETKWKARSQRYLFESHWYNVRQDAVVLPSGDEITYTLIEHPGFVVVVPLTDDGDVLLEHIYRYTIDDIVIECPAGGLDGESPEDAARRELREETGWIAGTLTPLGCYFGSTGISNERFWIFLATNLRDTGQTQREPTEQMTVARVPLARAIEMAERGEIADGPSALALWRAERHLATRSLPPAAKA